MQPCAVCQRTPWQSNTMGNPNRRSPSQTSPSTSKADAAARERRAHTGSGRCGTYINRSSPKHVVPKLRDDACVERSLRIGSVGIIPMAKDDDCALHAFAHELRNSSTVKSLRTAVADFLGPRGQTFMVAGKPVEEWVRLLPVKPAAQLCLIRLPLRAQVALYWELGMKEYLANIRSGHGAKAWFGELEFFILSHIYGCEVEVYEHAFSVDKTLRRNKIHVNKNIEAASCRVFRCVHQR